MHWSSGLKPLAEPGRRCTSDAMDRPVLLVVVDPSRAPARTPLHALKDILCRCNVRSKPAVDRAVARAWRKIAEAGNTPIVITPAEAATLSTKLVAKRAETGPGHLAGLAEVLDHVLGALKPAGVALRARDCSSPDYDDLLP